jgi:hypothetical protein
MVKFIILFLFAVSFIGCEAKPSSTKIQNLRAVTTTKNGDSITEYFGDFVFVDGGENCCYNCEVTNSVAEQVLKNPEFEVGCVSENVMIVSIIIGFVFCLFFVFIFIAIKD